PKARSGVVGLLTVAIALVAGLLVAAGTLPFTSAEAASTYWYVFLAVPLLGGVLLPPVFNPLMDRALRLARRGGLERPLRARGLGIALLWSVLSWAGFGVQMWLLVRTLGAGSPSPHMASLLPLAVGAFALAWTAGFLFVIAPAGAGVREVVLVVSLSPVLGSDKALLAALVSRALMTLGDGVVAGVAILLARRHVPNREALAS
ncbi:MAG: lysylphosphatidylglycerol synthase domain-containing protein, partial [Mycobacteriales bacterium]